MLRIMVATPDAERVRFCDLGACRLCPWNFGVKMCDHDLLQGSWGLAYDLGKLLEIRLKMNCDFKILGCLLYSVRG